MSAEESTELERGTYSAVQENTEHERSWVSVGPGASEANLIEPTLCGYNGIDREVHALAKSFYKKAYDKGNAKLQQTPLSMSWCVGPCLLTLFRVSYLSFLVHPMMLGAAFFSATCNNGIMVYSYYCWCPMFAWVCFLLVVEIWCLKHATVPYLQQVGAWMVGGNKVSFTTWAFLTCIVSVLSNLTVATPSFFAGTFLAQVHFGVCRADEVSKVWAVTVRHTPFGIFSHVSLPMIFCFQWSLQYVLVGYTLWNTWPRLGQWQAGGVNMQSDSHADRQALYKQDLELECIEFLRFRAPCKNGAGCVARREGRCRYAHPGEDEGLTSACGKHRLQGTRFFYYTLSHDFILSGAAFSILGEGLYMWSLCKMGIEHAQKSAEFQLDDIESEETRDADRNLGDIKKCIQHLHTISTRLKFRVLVNGILASGVQLQVQISMYAINSLIHNTSKGIRVQETCSILATIYAAVDLVGMLFYTRSLHFGKGSIARRLLNVKIPEGRDYSKTLEPLQKSVRHDLIQLAAMSTIFFALFIWAMCKMFMIHRCADRLWNFSEAILRFNLEAGCVLIRDGA